MATLEKIRSRSVILIATISIALLCFVIGDLLNNSSTLFNNSRNQMGEVDGVSMPTDEFQKQVSVMTNVFKESGQSVSDGDVRDAVWNSFIQTTVLNKEAEEIGMSVTAAELKEATMGENVHPIMRQIPIFYNQKQQFDKNILINVLSEMDKEGREDLKNYWMFWEKRIQESILSDKLNILASNAMSTPKSEIEFLSKLYGKDCKVAVASKPYRSLADSTFVPSESDITKKYNEKKELFKTDGYRIVKCIVFDVNPSEEDFAQTEKKVKNAEEYLKTVSEKDLPFYVSQETDSESPFNPSYQTETDIDYAFRSFAFSAPVGSVAPTQLDGNAYKTAKVLSPIVTRADSVKISVIPVGAPTPEAMTAKADSILNVLNLGADFTEVASKVSSNPSDWGWIREGQTKSDLFDSIVFNTNVGQIAKVVIPEGGIFLVKVNEKTSPVKKVRIAVISNKVLASNETFRTAYEKANNFIAVNNTKEKFESAAEKENYLVRELGPLSENQSNVYVIENGRPIIKWAFESKLGDVCTKPFDSKNKYVIGYVNEIVEEGYIPTTSQMVQNQIKNEVIKDMKAESLMKDMSGVSDLSKVGNIDTITIAFDMPGIQGYGSEPALVSAISKAEPNKIVSPVKGENGVFAFQVIESNESASAGAKLDRAKENVRAFVFRSLIGTMMEEADVDDNRSTFY